MKKLLISAAALALMAAPALAQEHRGDRDHGDRGPQPQQAAPAPAPAPAPAAAAPAPAPARQQGIWGREARPGATMPAPGRPQTGAQNAPQPAPANNFRDRDNDGRRDYRDRNNDGRPDFRRPGGPGFQNGRNDWSRYHRTFTAPRRFHAPSPYRRPPGWYYQRWTYGQILPSIFWGSSYWLNDWDDFGLMDPPPGTVWVRYGDDALLIDRYTGEVIQVEYGIFY